MRLNKNLHSIHTLPKYRKVVKKPVARVRNLNGGDIIEIRWDLNYQAKRDEIFEIKIGENTALIDKQELMHYIRAV